MGQDTWIYYTPQFESDYYNPDMMKYSPWSGHRNFAYDYVRNVKPSCIVELGSYYGCSSFAFLQAIKDGRLTSKFCGVDTWEGDEYTKGDYRENIYEEYRKIQDSCFDEQKPQMLRMTFDQALNLFEDGTIDLLHIDGSHTYENVKNDYVMWKKKVKENGVIFFHDVGEEQLFGKTMGSHVLWTEIKKEDPFTLEFPFSFGLGVLFRSQEQYEKLSRVIDLAYYQQQENTAAVEFKDQLRKDSFEIRNLKKSVDNLEGQNQIRQRHLECYQQDTESKNKYIQELEIQKEELAEKCRTTFEAYQSESKEYERVVHDFKENVQGKEKYISQLRETIEKYKKSESEKDNYILELLNTRKDYEKLLEGKESYIGELEKEIDDCNHTIAGKEQYIEELSETITHYEQTVEGKESYIEKLKETIERYSRTVAGKEKYIEELKETIVQYDKTTAAKEGYIEELKETIDQYDKTTAAKEGYIEELKETIDQYDQTVIEKENYIKNLRNTLGEYDSTVTGKEKYIEELRETIEKYDRTVAGKDQYIRKLRETIGEYDTMVAGKENYIRELRETVEKYDSAVTGKEKYIEELRETIEKYDKTAAGKDQYIEEMEGKLKKKDRELEQLDERLLSLKKEMIRLPFGRWRLSKWKG